MVITINSFSHGKTKRSLSRLSSLQKPLVSTMFVKHRTYCYFADIERVYRLDIQDKCRIYLLSTISDLLDFPLQILLLARVFLHIYSEAAAGLYCNDFFFISSHFFVYQLFTVCT